jgi:hypothetical protein
VLRLLCFLLVVSLAGTAHRILAFDSSYWVWHRATRLTPNEVEELERQHVTRLYWEVGEVGFQDGQWSWISQPVPREARSLSRLRVIPVVQIIPDEGFSSSNGELIALLKSVAECGQLQIDCDCPDRLLDRYGQFLGELHREVPTLSLTALAHWIHHPAGRRWHRMRPRFCQCFMIFTPIHSGPVKPIHRFLS